MKKKEPFTVRGICVKCGVRAQTSKGRNKAGEKVFRATCYKCHTKKYDMGYGSNARRRKKYTCYKKDSCERCGFIPEKSVQLDCHHLDGNHQNNQEENIMTLCANCHRLVHSK